MKNHPVEFRAGEARSTTRPRYLYIVEYRGLLFHLTGHDQVLVVTGLPASKGAVSQPFSPAAVVHTDPEQSSDPSQNRIEMTVGINDSTFTDQLRENLLFSVPSKLTVTIARANPADDGEIVWGSDTFVVFKGVATNLVFGASAIGIPLVSILMQAEGIIPRYVYQKTCQHALYGTFCGANPAATDNRLDAMLTAVDARQRFVEIIASHVGTIAIEDHTFKGGTLTEFEGPGYSSAELSKITISGAELLGSAVVRLHLAWWSRTLDALAPVRLQRGCRKTLGDCDTFANRANFGGIPWIPHFSPSLQGIR